MATRMDPLVKIAPSLLFFVSFFSGSAFAESISVPMLSAPPVIDGVGGEWSDHENVSASLRNIQPQSKIKAKDVSINAGVYGDNIYFYLVWDDETENLSHKSWIWNKEKNKYIRDSDREDRMAMQFEISGNYSTNWFSGNEFHADMWHWKSSRSNPMRIAHDKSTRVSKNKLLRAYKHTDESGNHTYLARPSDSGDKLYSSKRYHSYQGERVPKYLLNKDVSGSVADVEAMGKWSNGQWHLELRRALNTGNEDDVMFKLGTSVKSGIAIFDSSDNEDHAISDILIFHLADQETAELSEQ